MLRPWKVGTLFGIRVNVHFSCLLLVVLALLTAWNGGSLARALTTAALVPAGIYLVTGAINLIPVPIALFVAFAGQRELWAVRRVEEERAREAEEEQEVGEALPVEVSDRAE